MMICPGCYKEVKKGYCLSCRKKLFNGQNIPTILPFETPKDKNLKEFQSKTKKLSISGVQLKYSLRIENKQLKLSERDGQFILKPIPPTVEIEKNDQAPENEHLTMQIASQIFGIATAENALIYFQDGTPAYITRRFDVKADGTKYQQEDMAQLSGKTKQSRGEDFKYDGTYEEVGKLIRKYAAAALPSLENFFKILVFNYIFSNGDAHLKNFSLVQTDMKDYALSKAYDLMSTAIHTPDEGQTALDLYDNYTDSEFYAIYGVYGQHAFSELAKRLGIPKQRAERILTQMLSSRDKVRDLISRSFLSKEAKEIYVNNYERRLEFMGLTPALIMAIVDPDQKGLPNDKAVELIFPRAKRLKGRFIESLPNNKYRFESSDHIQTTIDGDQLYAINRS
ncbi:HipA domain-containing protein [Pedobacter gandavensis]|uniref:HipA domain-containing protein n=1 Tax=Pedobacter gandavensis TaxID=2679963 RepID=UPI00292FF34E|nr:HipA domain-containing protein [Pedobacter gandavensis]